MLDIPKEGKIPQCTEKRSSRHIATKKEGIEANKTAKMVTVVSMKEYCFTALNIPNATPKTAEILKEINPSRRVSGNRIAISEKIFA